ncbi:hypothetical protein, variant [Verruconis gallopava]|uniref:rRNA methyltransferase 2, mitochondrial n=1 Tax=Verruconis gallopava TaxID=253628 RepID=A0A0D2AFH4_9PEZI|nr:hypothetical protein, variant [Verruconis gallopava]KIW05723.1 hypothetical protein, variant [Verruconis gallopava]
MLTQRVFRQLTDSVLFDTRSPSICFCATRCCRITPPSSPRGLSSLRRSEPRFLQRRNASSSSSTRWKSRQARDHFSREAKVNGLKSRAAFKLLEIDARYRLFKPGQTVVDLGYAPGSWSQVAQTKTSPGGRVIGIDILPVQPPRGVSTIQGNFLSKEVRDEVRRYVLDPDKGRPKRPVLNDQTKSAENGMLYVEEEEHGYLDMERHADLDLSPEPALQTSPAPSDLNALPEKRKLTLKDRDAAAGRVIDVLLSDMMQNTSGIPFKDHAGSMDLCFAALTFAFDTLRTGGAFVCKFYTGSEDKMLEMRLKKLFEKVVREKPESSRSESKEAYFIGLRRKEDAGREEVLG